MAHRVVCISGADGAEADEVARIVAEQLGYRLVDEALVAHAARVAGVDTEVVADVERRTSFLRRLLDDLGSGAGVSALAVGGGYVPPADDAPSSEDLRVLIRAAIEETAAGGDAVIVAHAASIALADRDDTLRVLVTAPDGVRSGRLAEARGLSDEQAKAELKDADARRARYLRTFYGVSAESPAHYDLVLSTERLVPTDAAALIVQAAKQGGG
jgi:cytidylate kinase